MNTRLSLIALSVLAFSACTPDPEVVALEQYLTDAEAIGDSMMEMGTKFETLMNVQGDTFAWTDAEEQELDAVHTSLIEMEADAEAMVAPAILSDIHPLLIESIQEMRMAVEGVLRIAQNPAIASIRTVTEIETHATNGEALGTQYAEELEAAIAAEYPEMMEE